MERFLLFVALSVGTGFGQQAPAAGALAGRVVESTTKEGVRKATVLASADASTQPQAGVARFNPPTIYSAVTDESGAFRFSSLPPGKYSLRAEKPGFLPAASGKSARATVVAGEEAKGAEIAMAKHGVISGRVTDAEGEPLEQVSVQVVPARPARGANFGSSGQAMTDDRGEFRVPRLPAGSYKILAEKAVHSFATPNAPAPGEPLLIDAPTYFPSAAEAGSASEVTVGSGEERSGVEIRMRRTPAVRVTGRVVVDGSLEAPVSVTLQPAPPAAGAGGRGGGGIGRSMQGRSAIASVDGVFQIPQVTPGDYLLMANLYRPGAALNAITKLRVGPQDVDGVTLNLQPMVRVTGRVVAEGNGKLSYGLVHVGLQSADLGIPGGGGGQVKQDGTFVLENLQRMRLTVNQMAPRGWYLKSVSLGGQRQPGLEVDLSGGDAVMELVFSDRPGKVSGTVEGTVEGVAIVVALPDNGRGAPLLTNLYKTAAVTQPGNAFKIEDVPPGNYLIVACPPALSGMLSDPALWERVKSRAVSVKVEEGGTVPASPRLINESDLDEK
jgi:hypothetical protein